MLDDANTWHPNIKLVRQVGSSVSFLDVLVENNDGTLATSVYHKPAAEPYVVPFTSDHSRHMFRNIIHTALLRAARYSSTLATFDNERRLIILVLLYNGYFSTMFSNQWNPSELFLGIHLDSYMHNFSDSSLMAQSNETSCL